MFYCALSTKFGLYIDKSGERCYNEEKAANGALKIEVNKMNDKLIIRAALKYRGMSQPQLAKKMGYSSVTSVGSILNKGNCLRSDVLFKFLNALGFEIAIRPKDGKETEWILLDNADAIQTDFVKPYISEEETAKLSEIKSENAAAMLDSLK